MKRTHTATLKVARAKDEDIVRDIARINEIDRGGLPSGHVYFVCAKDRQGKYLIVRGSPKNKEGAILSQVIALDEASRNSMNVTPGDTLEFSIRRAGPIGKLRWAWSASDPTYSIPAKLGIVSVALALLSFVPSAWGTVSIVLFDFWDTIRDQISMIFGKFKTLI